MGERSTLLESLRLIALRDLDGLGAEVRLYPDDATPWAEVPGLPNAGGTLILHVAGSLRHYIGAVLGRTGYARDRDREFSTRGLSRAALLEQVDLACRDVGSTLERLDPSVLDAEFPEAFAGNRLSTRLFLLHLLTHLAYHLGQIDGHRRASTGDRTSARVLAITALSAPPRPESA